MGKGEIRDKAVVLEEPCRHRVEKEVEETYSIATNNADQLRQNQLKISRHQAQSKRKN